MIKMDDEVEESFGQNHTDVFTREKSSNFTSQASMQGLHSAVGTPQFGAHAEDPKAPVLQGHLEHSTSAQSTSASDHNSDATKTTASGKGKVNDPESADPGVLSYEALVSDVVALMFQCQNFRVAGVDTVSKLSSGLRAVQSYFVQASEELKRKLADTMVEQPGVLVTIWDFSTDIYKSLGTGVSGVLGYCLIWMRNCLFGWCEQSQKVRQSLAERGVIEKLSCELAELRTVPEINEFTKYLILLDISLEYTLAQYTPSHEQFKEIRLTNILQAYVLCSNDSIRIMTKLVLSHLVPILGENELSLLRLTEKEVSCFCEALAIATTSEDHTAEMLDIKFSALDLLTAMSGLVALPRNRELILQGDVNVIDFVAVVLATFGKPEIKAATVLLWYLFRDQCICRQILSSKSFIIDQIRELQLNSEQEIKHLSCCALDAAGCMENEDIPSMFGLAETHYQYHKYETCIRLCDLILQNTNKQSKENNSAKLQKGKALFHVYRQEQEYLQVATLSVKEYHVRRLSCYKKAMEVISLLGTALDYGYIDEDSSLFLDQAMVDHLREVNSKDRQRCLLCRKKAKLRRSHTWPESLLEAFTSGVRTDKTRKIFDCKKIGDSKAAGELTSWMLCTACEHILSSQAETDFAKKFFHRIYDPSCPSNDKPKQAQLIEYEEWLYCFCISIIFRGLVRVGILGHRTIYKLFQQSRKFLLQSPSDRTTAHLETPLIGLFIGPTKGSTADQKLGFINQVLHMPGLFVLSRRSLSDGTTRIPCRCNFFLAHCGIINIVVEFKSNEPPNILSSFHVSCQGGQYSVPKDEERSQIIPKGIWQIFFDLAKEFETKWLERSAKYVLGKLNASYKEPKPEQRDTFMLLAAARSDVKATCSQVQPSEDVASPKLVNLLPKQFSINRKENQCSSVILPPSHKILLHKHFTYSEGLNETLFLAVGTAGDYTTEKPYVIFHHAIPGLQFHVGFFISPDNFIAQDFLPDDDPKFNLDKIIQCCNARSIIHKVIANILEEKGFCNYYSILHRIKDQSELPTLDQKCANPTRCWYCYDLCESCLKPAAVGLAHFTHDGTLLRFCSDTCKQELQPAALSSKGPLIITSETFLTILSNSSCVPSGHRELLKAHACGVTPKQQPFKITLNVCISDGSYCFPPDRPYVMYHLRSIFHQHFLEFFISNTLSPEEPVPYCSNASISAVNQLKANKYIQRILKGALSSQGFPELCVLLQFEREARAPTSSCTTDSTARRKSPELEAVTSKIASIQLSAPSIPEAYLSTFSPKSGIEESSGQNILFAKLFHDAIELINTYQLESKIASPRCVELCIGINQAINSIYSILNSCSVHFVKELGDFMAEVPNAVKMLLEFTKEIYKNLPQGIDFVLIDSLLKVRMILSQTPEFSCNLAKTMAKSGWIIQMIREIQEVKDAMTQEEPQKHFLQLIIVLNFGILLRCSWNNKCLVQFEQMNFIEKVHSYVRSPVACIRALAVFTLSSLAQFLSEEQYKLLQLTDTELKHIIVTLTHAITSSVTAVECFDLKFSPERVLFVLNNMCVDPLNRQRMVQLKILETIILILEKGQVDEQERALELMWFLAKEPEIKDQVMKKCPPHKLLLDMLASSVVPALQVLSGCILWATNPGEETETGACLEYIHGCYQYQRYEECIEWCNKLIKSSEVGSNSKAVAKLYKGKGLFYHYQKQQKILKDTFQSMSQENFYGRQKLYNSDNKQVIALLGYALDQKLINIDDEASKMLDLAMIDYIWETNDLKSCERCLLCRQKAKLRRSHLCPKALLEDFATGMTLPEDRKIFLFGHHQEGPLKSPKEITLWMFCSKCEELLSGCGETQFASEFFRKIYDTSDPERPQKEQDIHYGKWLYEFALGIIFRGLAQKSLSSGSFANENDVYELFLQCRCCLLSHNAGTKPAVALLLSPTSPSSSKSAGFINQALHMATLFSIAFFRLSDGLMYVPISAEFFLAKFGIIHFLVKVNAADNVILPPETFINPLGGTYKVPENSSRKEILPAGIWSLLYFQANKLVQVYRKFPIRHVEATEKKKLIQPSPEAQETFMFEDAAMTDSEAMKSNPEKFSSTSVDINLLPQGYVLNRFSGSTVTLVLPDNHHILLHATFRQSAGEVEETIFLAIGTKMDYSSERPYLLYNCIEPSMQLSLGFCISTDNLSIGELLPGSPKEQSMKRKQFIEQASERLHTFLPEILKVKGVFSFCSLKHRMALTGKIPCVDTKCVLRCWYCNDLCDNCLVPAVVGLEVVTKDLLLKFCSSQCQYLCCGTEELAVNVDIPKLTDQKELLMHIAASGSNPIISQFNVQMQIYQSSGFYGLTADDGCYVTYQFRSPFSQELLEFFVSNDLSPTGLLPYLTTKQAFNALQVLKKSGLVQSILRKAFQLIGIKDLCALVLEVRK